MRLTELSSWSIKTNPPRRRDPIFSCLEALWGRSTNRTSKEKLHQLQSVGLKPIDSNDKKRDFSWILGGAFWHLGAVEEWNKRHWWPKYWSVSFRICPSSEHSGLISFRMDMFDLLAVQGTLKSLLQHHNSKASMLWQSACFMGQLSLPYIATGKTIALTMWTFVGNVYAF